MKNVKLIIAYDGKKYLGWQKNDEGPSIEKELQNTLEQIFQCDIKLQAASRTDAGVHAREQCVNFYVRAAALDHRKLLISLNSLLPCDIAVVSIEDAPSSFHPTLDCVNKEYRYYICNTTWQYPEYRNYSWHYPYHLDITEMKKACHYFLGTHDYSAFTNVKNNESYDSHVRTIDELTIEHLPHHRFCIHVQGKKFMYKMVRNIVGTLIYIGNGKIRLNDLENIFDSRNRVEAGVTAPAHGLFLHHISYK